MSRWMRAVPAVLLLAAGVLAAPGMPGAQDAAVPQDAQGRPRYVPGEVLVLMRPGLPLSALGGPAAALMRAGLSRRLGGPATRFHRLALQAGTAVPQAVAAFAADPAVAAAAPDYLSYRDFTTDDPAYLDGVLWGFLNTGQGVNGGYGTHNPPDTPDHDIDAPETWDLGLTGAGQIVAVIDEGIHAGHRDLAANMQDTSAFALHPSPNFGYDFAGAVGGAVDDPDNDPSPVPATPSDFHTHATHVAGIVAAVQGNATGVLGTAFGATVVNVKVFPDDETGATDADIISALDYVRGNGIPIANLSLGRPGVESPVMRQAVLDAIAGGVLLVVAAGNSSKDNDRQPEWPGNYAGIAETADGVITVAASDQADYLASFSNYGRNNVTLAAPGVNIWSTVYLPGAPPNDVYAAFQGTSMSSPMVAGVAALVREQMLAEGLTPTPATVKARIVDTADLAPALKCRVSSGKRVNAYNAVTGTTTPAVDNTVCDHPVLLIGSGGSSTCLVTWLTEDYVPRSALDPLRSLRDFLWRQGPWGQALVRLYYRISAAIIARLEGRPTTPPVHSPGPGAR